MLIKVDLHNHTCFSFDGEMNPRQFLERYASLGFGAVAVTDHNTRYGALAVRELDPPFKVIVGCEVGSKDGEIIGLFLEKDIRPLMSAVDTAKAIHDAGGLVLVPHPFVKIVHSRIREKVLPALLPHIDIVEGLNARGVVPAEDLEGLLWARARGLPVSAGSDAHLARGAGTGYVLMEDFNGPSDFLENLRAGALVNLARESLLSSGLNYLRGLLFGKSRVRRMKRDLDSGVPLRQLWDDRADIR
jgi:predicted metal-dependent phosphoesterase TrpH